MSEEKAKLLLEKYANGQASPEEREVVEQWYANLDAAKKTLPAIQKVLIRDAMLSNIQKVVANRSSRKQAFISPWIRIAAAVILVATVSFSIWRLSGPSEKAAEQIIASTHVGERKKIILSDGSEITLAPLAKISYPLKFNSHSREISLIEGEAFFSIAHEENRTFQVKLPAHLKVTVLGTSFLIRAYRANAHVEVAVSTGKVAIQNKSILLGTLVKNQKLQFNKVTGKSILKVIQHTLPVKIQFVGTTLQQVIQRMEYTYNIKILLSDKAIADLKTTATFSSEQRPEEILDLICSLHHLKLGSDQNHQTFKIYK
jgi:transmembrane sensor